MGLAIYAIYLETQQTGLGLGADPVEGLLHYLGEWGMISLLSLSHNAS